MMDIVKLEREQIVGFVRDFLEKQPLYTSTRFELPESQIVGASIRSNWPDSVMYDCRTCKRHTTWARYERSEARNGRAGDWIAFELPAPGNYLLVYRCARCNEEMLTFSCVLLVQQCVYVLRKVGQWPAWSIEVAPNIAAALPGNALEFYKRGVICLSQNFGLGAVGYFRRTVEEVLGHLLDLVEQAAKLEGNQEALGAVAAARRGTHANDKLQLVAAKLPGHLRPGGKNPLASLYDEYSVGLHARSDENCLGIALRMRAVVDYVMPALTEQLQAAREYEAALAKAGRQSKTAPQAPPSTAPTPDEA